jgi:hypothetical protein
MQRLLEPYFLAWAAVLPVMSLLVFPAVQGTTPAYLFALGSVGWLLFIRRETAASYVRSLMFFVATWAALTLGSQAALFLSEVTSFQQLRMVDLGTRRPSKALS